MSHKDYLKLLHNKKSIKFKTYQGYKSLNGVFSRECKEERTRAIIKNVLTNEHLYIRLQNHRKLPED